VSTTVASFSCHEFNFAGARALVAALWISQVFVDVGSSVQTTADGQSIIFGNKVIGGTEHDARRRRLQHIGGRQLVEVGEVSATDVQNLINAHTNHGVTSGTATLSLQGSSSVDFTTATQMLVAAGYLVAVETIDGKTYYVVQGNNGGPVYWVAPDGAVLSSRPSRRLRRLAVDDSREHAAHRRLFQTNSSSSSIEPPECEVYHCFAGEARCTEPSPRELCARWNVDGSACIEPLCAYIDEKSSAVYDEMRRRERRQMNEVHTECPPSARGQCASNQVNKMCKESTSTCVQCLDNSDCAGNCFLDYEIIPLHFCHPDTNMCAECTQDSHCADHMRLKFCGNQADQIGKCVECTTNAHCESKDCKVDRGYCVEVACFPAHATVLTPDGPKRMDELRAGERVLVDGGTRFSTVYMSAHEDRRAGVQHEFVRVELSSGHALELSPDHLAMADDAYVRAADVRVGMTMRVASGTSDSAGSAADDGTCAAAGCTSTVTATERVYREGLFAPVTLHGDIVVDGVVASSYTAVMSRALPAPLRHKGALLNAFAHAMAAPMRMLHALDPGMAEHIMRIVSRTDSGGFDPYALWGPGGLLAIKSAIDASVTSAPAPSAWRRLLATCAAYGFVLASAAVAAASNTVSGAASIVWLTIGIDSASSYW